MNEIQKPYNILIVDDEKIIRDLLYKILKSQGFNVYWAKNGIEAMSVVKNKSMDLVITDISMPKMDGTDLANRIRYMYKGIPVVIMSAHGTRDNFIKALKYGAVDFIVKGFFEPEDFINRVHKYLRGEFNLRSYSKPEKQAGFAKKFQEATEPTRNLIKD